MINDLIVIPNMFLKSTNARPGRSSFSEHYWDYLKRGKLQECSDILISAVGNRRPGKTLIIDETEVVSFPSRLKDPLLLSQVKRLIELREDKEKYRQTILFNLRANGGKLVSNTQRKNSRADGERASWSGINDSVQIGKSPLSENSSVDSFNSICEELGVQLL